MSGHTYVKSLNQNTFPSQAGAERPLLVDFSATWCGPCRMMAPAVEALAETYRDRLDVAVVDIDASPDLASRFGVTAVPTFLVFKDGQVVDQLVGAIPKQVLTARVEQHV
jgi:thioredoxin 1